MESFLGRFTLYDVIGHLVPGLLTILLLRVLAAGCDPALAVSLPDGAASWCALLFFGYVAGHIVQGATGLLVSRSAALSKIGVSDALLRAARERLGARGVTVAEGDVLAVADGLQVPYPDRDIFVARQGFYRGMLGVAALTAFVGLLCAVFRWEPRVGAHALVARQMLLLGVTGVALVFLFLHRYRRFVRYEVAGGLAALVRER